MAGFYFHDPGQFSKLFADRSLEKDRMNRCLSSRNSLMGVLPAAWAKSMEAESREWTCTCPLGLGPWRDPLESRRESAPALEMPELRPVDRARDFKKSADACKFLPEGSYSAGMSFPGPMNGM
jgi:hypothetical protein